jgi:hypothetical protein
MVSPAGFDSAAVASSAIATKVAPMARARAPGGSNWNWMGSVRAGGRSAATALDGHSE